MSEMACCVCSGLRACQDAGRGCDHGTNLGRINALNLTSAGSGSERDPIDSEAALARRFSHGAALANLVEDYLSLRLTRTGPAPIAEEGVALIRDLYAIEADIRGRDPAVRLAVRQNRSAPILARIDEWLLHHRARASAKSPIGEALSYIAKYRNGLGGFLTDGRVEIDSNIVERTIRPIALNRKNALFAGHDAGAENWAVIASLIEICKMNSVNPHAWLSATLTAIVQGHKQSQIDHLLPWDHGAKL